MSEEYSAVEEVRQIRERIAARFGNDVDRYGEYLSEYQKKFGTLLELLPDEKESDRPAA